MHLQPARVAPSALPMVSALVTLTGRSNLCHGASLSPLRLTTTFRPRLSSASITLTFNVHFFRRELTPTDDDHVTPSSDHSKKAAAAIQQTMMTAAGGNGNNRCLISWRSKLHTMVCLSSAVTEYVAATEAAKEILWIRSLLEFLQQDTSVSQSSVLLEDNAACITISNN